MSEPPPPQLSIVTERVAHDLRGLTGLLVSALHELSELQRPGSGESERTPTAVDLLQLAGRVAFRLERLAARLDAVASFARFPPALVDLEPLIKQGVAHAVRCERRADVAVTLPKGGVTRVCVVPHAVVEAIEDVVAWALKRSRSTVLLTVDLSTAAVARIVVTASGVNVAPAMVEPFQDPLGMAHWLLLGMGGTLHAETTGDGVTLVVSMPRTPVTAEVIR